MKHRAASAADAPSPAQQGPAWRPSLPTGLKAYVGSALDTASGVPSWLVSKAAPAAAEGAGMLRSAAHAVGGRSRSSQYDELLEEELLNSAAGPRSSSGPKPERRSSRGRDRDAALRAAQDTRQASRHSMGERTPEKAPSPWGAEEQGGSSHPNGRGPQEGGYASEPDAGTAAAQGRRRGGEPAASLLDGDDRSSRGNSRPSSARLFSKRAKGSPEPSSEQPALICFGDSDDDSAAAGGRRHPPGEPPGANGAPSASPSPGFSGGPQPLGTPVREDAAAAGRSAGALHSRPREEGARPQSAGASWPAESSMASFQRFQETLANLPSSSPVAERVGIPPGDANSTPFSSTLPARPHSSSPTKPRRTSQGGGQGPPASHTPPDSLLLGPAAALAGSLRGRRSPYNRLPSADFTDQPDLLGPEHAPPATPEPSSAPQQAQQGTAHSSPASSSRSLRPSPPVPEAFSSAAPTPVRLSRPSRPPPAPPHTATPAQQQAGAPDAGRPGEQPPGGPAGGRGLAAREGGGGGGPALGARSLSARGSGRSLLDGPEGEASDLSYYSASGQLGTAPPPDWGQGQRPMSGDLLGPLGDAAPPRGANPFGDPLGGDPAGVFSPLGSHTGPAGRPPPLARSSAASSRASEHPRAAPAEDLPSPSYNIFEPRAPLENGGSGSAPPSAAGSPGRGAGALEALSQLSGQQVLERLAAGVPLRKKWVSRMSRPEGDAAPKVLRTLRCHLSGGKVLLRYNHQGVKGLVDKQEVSAAVQRVEDPGGGWRPRKCLRVHTSRGVLALEPLGAYEYSLWVLGLNTALVAARTRRQSYVLACKAVDVPRDGMFVAG